MRFMIVERFDKPDASVVYARLREKGRLAPEGLRYVTSWVERSLRCCFQVMETDDRALLDDWISNWNDIVDFEVYEVVSSAEAAAIADGVIES